MKAIPALALMTVGAALIESTPLGAAEAGRPTELSSNRSQAYESGLSYDVIRMREQSRLGEQPGIQVRPQTGVRLQDEHGVRLEALTKPEAAAPPVTLSSPKIELRAGTPNNVFQSVKHPGLECSGILVQLVRDNPLQLFSPLAPARYGDGEANTVHDIITGRAEGLKVLALKF